MMFIKRYLDNSKNFCTFEKQNNRTMKKDLYFWLLLIDLNEDYHGVYCINFFMLMFGKGLFSRGRMLFGLEYRKNIDITLSILFINITIWKNKNIQYED